MVEFDICRPNIKKTSQKYCNMDIRDPEYKALEVHVWFNPIIDGLIGSINNQF